MIGYLFTTDSLVLQLIRANNKVILSQYSWSLSSSANQPEHTKTYPTDATFDVTQYFRRNKSTTKLLVKKNTFFMCFQLVKLNELHAVLKEIINRWLIVIMSICKY